MIAALLPVAALLASVALLLVGNGLQSTLLPVRGQAADFGSVALGVLGSSYFAGFAIGCILGPWIVARAGHIRTFAAMVSVASSVVLAHALLVSPAPWWVMRFASGMCFAVLYMVVESWLNDRATNQTRGRVFAVYLVINMTMIAVGQLLLLLDEAGSIALFLAASILVSLAAVPVALTKAEAPPPITAVRFDLRGLYRTSPAGIVGCFVVGLTNGAFWALAPAFADATAPAGWTAEGEVASDFVAVLMTVAVAAGALGQWPLGLVSDRIDRRIVMTGTAGMAGLAGVALVVAGAYAPGLVLPFAFWLGLVTFPIYSLAVAHVNDHVAREKLVEAAGGLLLVWALGAVLGPILASAAMRVFGPTSLFGYTAAMHFILCGFVLFRMRLRRAPRAEDRASYVEAAFVGQTVSNLDPLSQQEPPDGPQPAADQGVTPQHPPRQ